MAEVRTDGLFEEGFRILRALCEEAETEAYRGAWKDTVKATAACKNQLDILQKQAMMLRDGALCEVGAQMTLPTVSGGAEPDPTALGDDDPGLRFLGSEDYATAKEVIEQASISGATADEVATVTGMDEAEAYQLCEFLTRRGICRRAGAAYIWLDDVDLGDPFEDELEDADEPQVVSLQAVPPEPLPEGVAEAMEPAEA